MSKIETHPAPEKILRQITAETINALALGDKPDSAPVSLMENGVKLIAKAWDLPQESLQSSLDLIQQEKQNILGGSTADVLPHGEILETYDGPMIVELLWGLFETAVRLEEPEDREAIHKLALLVAECLSLDSWVDECGPTARARIA